MSGEHDHDGVSCKQAHDLLFAFLEGELSVEQSAQVRDHFAVCPPCESFLAGYKQTPKLCRKALEREVPQALTDRLCAFLRGKRGG